MFLTRQSEPGRRVPPSEHQKFRAIITLSFAIIVPNSVGQCTAANRFAFFLEPSTTKEKKQENYHSNI